MVDVPGDSSVAYSSYKDMLATIYYNAWVTPEGAANDEADAIVKITVARDGTVVTSRIITPSGDAKVDESVRRALNRVSSVDPLPDQSKSEQEFTIDFNLKTKQIARMKRHLLDLLKIALSVVLVAAAGTCRAQDDSGVIKIQKETTRPGLTPPIPVSLDGFSGEVADVLKFDLYVQGFSFVCTGRRAISNQRQQRRQCHRARRRQICEEGDSVATATPARTCGGRRTPSPTTSFSPSPAKKASG